MLFGGASTAFFMGGGSAVSGSETFESADTGVGARIGFSFGTMSLADFLFLPGPAGGIVLVAVDEKTVAELATKVDEAAVVVVVGACCKAGS